MIMTFWILLTVFLVLLVFKLYGKPGVVSVMLLGGALLTKDAALHFLGKTAECIVVGLIAVIAIAIFIIRRQSQEK